MVENCQPVEVVAVGYVAEDNEATPTPTPMYGTPVMGMAVGENDDVHELAKSLMDTQKTELQFLRELSKELKQRLEKSKSKIKTLKGKVKD